MIFALEHGITKSTVAHRTRLHFFVYTNAQHCGHTHLRVRRYVTMQDPITRAIRIETKYCITVGWYLYSVLKWCATLPTRQWSTTINLFDL